MHWKADQSQLLTHDMKSKKAKMTNKRNIIMEELNISA